MIISRGNLRLAARKCFICRRISSSSEKIVIYQRIHADASKAYEIDPTSRRITSNHATTRSFEMQQSIHYILPKNYPESVGAGYTPYVQYQMASTALSSAAGVLSMQSLLTAIGIGAGSLPIAATLNWVLKDGLGQLGGILFASYVNNKFDSEPKRWRFLAALSLELSCLIELLTPLVPAYFLPIASLANIGKNISFLASSASRAAIHISFAKQHNLADITAKTGSQNILSSMLGTGLGLSVTYLLGAADIVSQCMAFSTLSLTSLACNYKSLQYVTINTLNMTKLFFIIDHSFRDMINSSAGSGQIKPILTPTDLKERETFLVSTSTIQSIGILNIEVGSDFDLAFPSYEDYKEIKNILVKEKYLVNLCMNTQSIPTIYVLFYETADKHDIIRAMLHARILAHSGSGGREEGGARNIKTIETSYERLQSGNFLRPTTHVCDMDSLSSELLSFVDHVFSLFYLQPTINTSLPTSTDLLILSSVELAHEKSDSSPLSKSSTVMDVFIDEIILKSDWKIATGLLETRQARLTEQR